MFPHKVLEFSTQSDVSCKFVQYPCEGESKVLSALMSKPKGVSDTNLAMKLTLI